MRFASAGDATDWVLGLVRDAPSDRAAREARGLRAIRALTARLGSPEARLPCVHIAGSKGKGSTAQFVEAIARRAGVRTGLYTSPHLERWNERIRIDGTPVSDRGLVAAVDAVAGHAEAIANESPELSPSFFDALTAAALWCFEREAVELAIMETGLGGRLDATNVVRPLATAITTIELEHTDKLGDTRAEIAGEKAGIIKPGVPCVAGALPRDALDVVVERATAVNAPLSVVGEDATLEITSSAADNTGFELEDAGFQLRASVPSGAPYMAHNAALAAMLARRALPSLDAATIADALAGTTVAGRFEILAREPTVIVDAAHTEVAVRELARALPAGRLRLLVSLSGTRDAAILAPLVGRAVHVTTCRADAERSADAAPLAAAIKSRFSGTQVEAIEAVPDALARILATASRDDVVLVTGSVYLAGAARGALRARAAH